MDEPVTNPNVASGTAADPAVDVIIPTRNRGELTRDAIESVRAQTYANWRLVIVDDASDDGSDAQLAAFVAGDDRMTLVRRAAPGGSNAARQAGLGASTAPLIASLDSDDLWRPAKLERQVRLLGDVETTGTGLVVCWHEYTRIEDGRRRPVQRPSLDGRVNPLPSYNMSTPLVTRVALEAAGGFASAGAEGLQTTEHVDLLVRLTAQTGVAVVPELLVDCRHHGGARNSDAQGTAQAAAEAAALLAALEPGLDDRPRIRAWLRAWVGARHLAIGDKRAGIAFLRSACAGTDTRTTARILRAYGPFTVKQVVRSMFGRGAR